MDSQSASKDTDDIIIPIMGPTGVGKSTFINTAAARNASPVGHDLESCTKYIQAVTVTHPDYPARRVVFIDTPGFDDTYLSDTEILKRIAVWLERSYRKKMKLSGIYYMHDITRTRMFGSAHRNFKMFKELCGPEGSSNVTLVTTKWAKVVPSTGQQREQDLAATYWKPMLEQGSGMARFTGEHESAWAIVNSILKKEPVVAVQIQKELVDLRKILPETEAARVLRQELGVLLQEHKSKAQARKHEPNSVSGIHDDDLDKSIRITVSQIQELKIPLSRRLKGLLGLT